MTVINPVSSRIVLSKSKSALPKTKINRAELKTGANKALKLKDGWWDPNINADSHTTKCVLGGMAGGAATGAAIGSCVPIVGTLFGGAVGALVGALGGSTAALFTDPKDKKKN
ncbi:MAG: hypothetical protein E7Z89_05495 [Cyanobacteria bacterium SIG28]|nr:hypothetical protein [Cyanobacteria bacterium SIG28]